MNPGRLLSESVLKGVCALASRSDAPAASRCFPDVAGPSLGGGARRSEGGSLRLESDVVSCDFRGRRSRVRQICGDAARQGRALQGAEVSPASVHYFLRLCGDVVYPGAAVCAGSLCFILLIFDLDVPAAEEHLC